MIERLELIEKRMNEIDGLLMDPSVLSDIKKSMKWHKWKVMMPKQNLKN